MKRTSSNKDYYLQHGLNADPFPQEKADELFYLTPELNHRIELIKHLLEFSEQLLIVTAPHGAGKTTLCQHLASLAEPEWSINLIEGKAELSIEELVHNILSDEVEKNAQEKNPVDKLNKYLEYCNRNEKIPVVFIDNAHELPVKVLRFVIQSACVTEAGLRWRVVLFSDNSLNTTLEDPQIKSMNTGLFHFIDVLPLNVEQTEFYINYRLTQSGSSGGISFTEGEIKQIHKVSAGLPAKINHLARQSLIDPALNTSSTSTNSSKDPFPYKAVFLSLTVVFGISIWLSMSGDEQDEAVHKNKLQLPPQETTLVDKKIEQANIQETKQAGSEELTKKIDVAVSASPELKPEAEETTKEAVELKEEVPEPVLVEASPELPETEQRMETIPSALESIKASDWLQTRISSEYALQLIGAVEVETIASFIAENRMDTDRLAWFKTKQGGEDWYVLIYGMYSDIESARADIKSLAPGLKNLHPWPRSIADIQQAIHR